jgi:DNA-3-methyladenine glycosylase
MKKVLSPGFFDRPTLTVARELLGKFLVRKIGDREVALMITETEAYDGPPDLGSHSARGRTARTEVLFGPSGIWYVYIIYGLHHMLNIVTKRPGAAVLIRGVEGFPKPGTLTKAFSITRGLNKMPHAKKSGLWIEDRGVVIKPNQIHAGPRIGIAYAKKWAKKPWRFVLKEHEPL